jgi:hypothetical protein
VSYAGVGLTNISEIHRLSLGNSTQCDNTCLTGPAVQIIGETKCFGKGKSTNLVKGAKAPNGTYFACQSGIHTCYPGGDCALVFLVLDLDILPGTEIAQYLNQRTDGWTRFQWDPILLPVLLGVALAGATATGATAIGLQQVQYSQLSEQIREDLRLVQQSIVTLQNQFDSLTAMVLQNPWGLDLITVEEGGICAFLGKECCFYANHLGIIRENTRQLLKRIKTRNRETFWSTGWRNWAPWIAPLTGPLTVLLLLLLLRSCVINLLARSICNRVDAVKL